MHVLIADGQFLLLIDMPIQTEHNSLKYMKFSVLRLIINILGVTYDETKAVATTNLQYRACQNANGQFCRINAPFQPLANPPSCVTALYAKNN